MHFDEESFLSLGPDLALEAVGLVAGLDCWGLVAFDYSEEFSLLFLFPFTIACFMHSFS